MIVKTEGIIFKSIKYSETSLILDIYTLDHGLKSFIISGVRKSRSKTKAGIFQVMNILNLVAYHKENDSLSRIKESNLNYPFTELPFNVIKSSIALFMIDIARHSVKEKYANTNLYNFLKAWLVFVDTTQASLSNLHLIFLIELAAILGFEIHDNYNDQKSYFNLLDGNFTHERSDHKYVLDQANSLVIHDLLGFNRSNISDYKIEKALRNEILDHLISFYKVHMQGFGEIKTLDIYRTVLS